MGSASVAKARKLLLNASLDGDALPEALNAVADACGGRSGQLIAFSTQRGVTGHWLTRVPEDFVRLAEAHGLTDAELNPRLRLGLSAAPLTLIADHDHVSAQTRARSAIYQDLFDRHDLPYNCQVVLARTEESLIRVSVTRTAKQGPFDLEALDALRTLVPDLEAAVRFQRALEHAADQGAGQAIAHMPLAVFALDSSGYISAMSGAARTLLQSKTHFTLVSGRLHPVNKEDAAQLGALLKNALALADKGGPAPPIAIGFRTKVGAEPMRFELTLLPMKGRPLSSRGALLLTQSTRSDEADLASILRLSYGLTQAEAAIALRIADGDTPRLIAAHRNVTLSTVRSQLQVIYAKLNIHRQAQLVSLVRKLPLTLR